MTDLLAELGKQLADRKVALLILPGLLFTAIATAAILLGHSHWADVGLLWRSLDTFITTAGRQQRDSLLRTALLLLGVLVAAIGSGLVAQVLAKPVELLMLGRWPIVVRWLSRVVVQRRQNAWTRLDGRYRNAEANGEQNLLASIAGSRNRIALIKPRCPTWIGDRLHAPAVRVRNEYGLGLAAAWPRLWLLLPDNVRETLAESRRRFDEATTLGAWSVLYLVLAFVWWPSAIVSLCVGITAWRRARATADVYAELVEATVDVYVGDLLEQFGDETRPIRPQLGTAAMQRFHKGT